MHTFTYFWNNQIDFVLKITANSPLWHLMGWRINPLGDRDIADDINLLNSNSIKMQGKTIALAELVRIVQVIVSKTKTKM